MGLTKQYLRYVPSGKFNIIASPGCNVVFVTLEGQEGRYLAVGASEDIVIWDMRLGEKVSKIYSKCQSDYYLLCNQILWSKQVPNKKYKKQDSVANFSSG